MSRSLSIWMLPLACGLLLACGCQNPNNPFAAGAQPWPGNVPMAQGQLAQAQELDRRIAELDANNRDLHAEVARWRQQWELTGDQNRLLKQRLAEATEQIQQTQAQKQLTEQQFAAWQGAATRRGGATITANNSLRQAGLPDVQIAGVRVHADGDLVRIVLSSDQLFAPNSSQLRSTAPTVLEQVARTISLRFRQNRVAIEGHTDSAAIGGRSAHELSTQQAMAVFDFLTRRAQLPQRQLTTVGHGSNFPAVSNGTTAGRGENRRVELVVYPESY